MTVCIAIFQFTPLREGRHARREGEGTAGYFNSRPSARGDSLYHRAICGLTTFQFTPLREGRRRKFWAAVVSFVFQFTPLREGRPPPQAPPCRRSISIHAPPRGATSPSVEVFGKIAISIHAPPRGATCCSLLINSRQVFQFTPLREGRHARSVLYYNHKDDFNSRPSARGDMTQATLYIGLNISIHAPPRGATPYVYISGSARNISIHAPPRGATIQNFRQGRKKVFQFTPLREGRRGAGTTTAIDNLLISIHAPPRGATIHTDTLRNALAHFNSRPSARGDARRVREVGGLGPFQFTPLREGRPSSAT